jgi:hypothetical protein
MSYFYTADEIVAKIKQIDSDIATARTAQQYSYDQGPAGQFGVQKGSITAMIAERDNWEKILQEHYPDAYQPANKIEFYEIGLKQG